MCAKFHDYTEYYLQLIGININYKVKVPQGFCGCLYTNL